MPKVKFVQEKKEIEVAPGANLRTEAMKAGIELYEGPDRLLNCRGFGMCATCTVWLKNDTAKNAGPMGIHERIRRALGFWALGHEEECRLACQTKVMGDLEVWTRPGYNWFGETAAAPAAKPSAPAPVAKPAVAASAAPSSAASAAPSSATAAPKA
ncbi:MAG: (2Fe-2S)-binding protein [Planctomycetes bacterium]|nr:(2Fe-2S)-binding protein [Planctomycetota bacterium]